MSLLIAHLWFRRLATAAAAAAAVLLVAACGSSASGKNAAPGATTAATTPARSSATEPAFASPTTKPPASPTPASGGTAKAEVTVTALDSRFNVKTIEAPANATFTVILKNEGQLPHNISFLDKQGGTPLSASANGEIITTGQEDEVTFKTPGPGTYFFFCAVHPKEMTGQLIVK